MVTSERLSVEGDQPYAQSGMVVAPQLAWILTAKESLEVSLSISDSARILNINIVSLLCSDEVRTEHSMNNQKEGCLSQLVQGEMKRWKSWSSSGGYSVVNSDWPSGPN